ncbi:MAG: threonine synthase, partial [Thermotogota bacterium]
MNEKNYHLKCVNCSTEYNPDEVLYACPKCGNRRGTLEVVYDFTAQTKWVHEKKSGIAKFASILPIQEKLLPTNVIVGDTPLNTSKRLAEEFNVKEVLIKDDGKNPTASFKDRASIV